MHQTIDKIFNKAIFWLVLFTIPLLFVNIRSDHDWGGDFAQYLKQAENIANGIPYTQSKYVFNENVAVIGPPAYPPGFPLLLAPVIMIYGLDFKALMIYQSIFLILFALSSFVFLSKFLKNWTSILLVLVMVYNPWMLSFKAEIMSDICFSFLFILILILHRWRSDNRIYRVFYLGLLISLFISIRTIGVFFLFAIAIKIAIDFVRRYFLFKRINLHNLRFNLYLLICSILFYFLLNFIVFPNQLGNNASYFSFFSDNFSSSDIRSNLTYYSLIIRNQFSPVYGNWEFMSVLLSSFAIALLCIGFFSKLIKQANFTDLLFISYMLIILVYPYRGSGFRFLLPVFPLMIYYMTEGISRIHANVKLKRDTLTLIALLLVLIMYIPGFIKTVRNKDIPLKGPHTNNAQEVFNFIKEETNENETIAFIKPRVLALFTNRYSITTNLQDSPEEIRKQYRNNNISYILRINLFKEKNVDKYISLNPNGNTLVFENRNFKLYKIKEY
ncbi:MAG: hypothetical protein K9G58_02385 [Bacteroidales bacterium]|nr:hypothetical protein [Bacteroidales bacterium]MCF8386902.1 hypothetical protein [Bacteroidales bacterium]MCF8396985.1 hypothetical protein [Bacteroidales bacterium]